MVNFSGLKMLVVISNLFPLYVTMAMWVMKCGIDAHGNEIWSNSLGDTVSSFVILSMWEKVSRRSIVGRGHTGHNLGSYEGFTQYVLSHMRPFLFGYHISFCCFFALKVVRCHHFGAHLKMFIVIFDLLPFMLNNGTVNGEMRS